MPQAKCTQIDREPTVNYKVCTRTIPVDMKQNLRSYETNFIRIIRCLLHLSVSWYRSISSKRSSLSKRSPPREMGGPFQAHQAHQSYHVDLAAQCTVRFTGGNAAII